ncbi:hypothetical protein EVAR_84454_1 [Eumeta japonica]|uniref:Uncharacterized protein n=1 Tax=Eumeta variegata TaxID=151549 RepID=A0A4C1W1L7_EUMVA|nr:hypothetical protein EVAR_84454_1 [Eumeta japonica]
MTYNVREKYKDSSEKNYCTSAEVATYRSNAALHTSSPRHNILHVLLRYRSATARRSVRRPSDEANFCISPRAKGKGAKTHYEQSSNPGARGVSNSHGLKTP